MVCIICISCVKNENPNIIQMCLGIIRSIVLNGELHAQRFQKLINLHLFIGCFMKKKIQSDGNNTV